MRLSSHDRAVNGPSRFALVKTWAASEKALANHDTGLRGTRTGVIFEHAAVNPLFSTASIVPGYVFILLVQKHLVRALTMELTMGQHP